VSIIEALTTARREGAVRLVDVLVELADLKGSIRTLAEVTVARNNAQDAQLADHEVRLRRGERWWNSLPGTLLVAACSSLASALTAVATFHH